MKSPLRIVVALALLAGVGLGAWVVRPFAQEVDSEPAPTPSVTDAELKIYIDVYTAMQADHGLTLDSAIQPYGMSVESFRDVERRIQNDPRFVERVRKALLEYASSRSAFALLSGTPPAGSANPTPTPQPGRSKAKRSGPRDGSSR
jgi:hypothetical protein